MALTVCTMTRSDDDDDGQADTIDDLLGVSARTRTVSMMGWMSVWSMFVDV